jgi:hypothetical protein
MNVWQTFLLFTIALTVCRVNGFVSSDCKDAESASDKLGRFFENANCTLHKKGQKIQTKLNQIHNTLTVMGDHFKNKLGWNRGTTKPEVSMEKVETVTVKPTTSKYDDLDFQIDVRMLPVDESQLTTRAKRDNSEEDQGKV